MSFLSANAQIAGTRDESYIGWRIPISNFRNIKMKQINYILVNETDSENAVRAIRDSRVSGFRHHIIVNSKRLSRVALIDKLVNLRQQYPNAKILGMSEIDGERIRPNESMNRLRIELSNCP